TDKLADTHTDRQTRRHTHRHTDSQTHTQTYRLADTHNDIQHTNKHTQTYRLADTHTDIQTRTHTHRLPWRIRNITSYKKPAKEMCKKVHRWLILLGLLGSDLVHLIDSLWRIKISLKADALTTPSHS